MKYLLENEETNRLSFRKTSRSDFEEWLAFFKDPSSFKYWTGQLETPEIECEKWFDRQAQRYQNDEGGMNALIEKKSNKLIGYSGLLVQKVDGITELEVAYSLLPIYRNQGFASEAAMKCRDFAFTNNFFSSLISIVSLTNLPSAGVAIKNGMKIEKETVYKDNPVNIFRINKFEWLQKK